MYLVKFASMPGESYRRRLRSLLYLNYVFPVIINSCALTIIIIIGLSKVYKFTFMKIWTIKSVYEHETSSQA